MKILIRLHRNNVFGISPTLFWMYRSQAGLCEAALLSIEHKNLIMCVSKETGIRCELKTRLKAEKLTGRD